MVLGNAVRAFSARQPAAGPAAHLRRERENRCVLEECPGENPQGRLPGRRPRHAVPAGHQGHAQGNAAGRRQAADPVCGRGGAGRRHRGVHLRHRPRQERHRGPFRPSPTSSRRRWSERGKDAELASSAPRSLPSRARSPIPASRSRSASAMRSGARATWSATSRSPCCWPTTWCWPRRPASAQMVEAYDEDRRQRGRGMDVPREQTNRYGILDVGDGRRPAGRGQGPGREAEAGGGAVDARRSSAATSCSPRCSTICDEQERGAGGEIQLTDAMAQHDRRRSPSTASASRARASTAATRPASSRPISPSPWRATIMRGRRCRDILRDSYA